jgi:hypothetical protein
VSPIQTKMVAVTQNLLQMFELHNFAEVLQTPRVCLAYWPVALGLPGLPTHNHLETAEEKHHIARRSHLHHCDPADGKLYAISIAMNDTRSGLKPLLHRLDLL